MCSFCQLASYGPILNQPRESSFLSSHKLYLTSQSIELSDFLCFGVRITNQDHCKNNGAQRASGWRGMQINAPVPGEHLFRVQVHDVCISSCHSICRAGRLD
jgi:hypothetical protein